MRGDELTTSVQSGGRSRLGTLHVVAVIGAGVRGRTFARRCAQAGLEVSLEDVLSSNLRKAKQDMAGISADLRGRVHLVSSVEDAVRNADVAIDFVPDELESKLEIFSMMDRMAPPRTIFCTPTTLSVSDLASCTYRPDRCVGIVSASGDLAEHVVLKQGVATSDETLAAVQQWLRLLEVSVELASDSFIP